MKSRFLLLALLAGFTQLAISQDKAVLDALWKELFVHWTAEDLAAAENTATKLIEEMTPKADDFQLGISMNSALHNRASLRFSQGDFKGAEEDLIRSVEQAGAIKPPPGLPAASVPMMMEMVNDRKRLSLRGLTNFYLAAGDFQRATETFEQATAIVPLWKREEAGSPTANFKILSAEVSSMEGTFYRRTGDYPKAMDAFLKRVQEIDGAWDAVVKMFGEAPNSMAGQMKMNYLRGRANCLMELAELASLEEKHEEAIGFCKEARESAIEMLPLYRAWAKDQLENNPAVNKVAIEGTMKGVETNTNYLIFERSAFVFRAAGEEKAALEFVKEGLKRRGEDFEQQRMLTLEYNVIRPEESFTMLGDLQAIVGEHAEAAASYDRAIALTKEQYPEGHPTILSILESYALLRALEGKPDDAAKIAAQVFEGRMNNLEEVLSFASESQRLAYRDSIDPWSLFASLNLQKDLYTTIIRTKGIVLDSILEDRAVALGATDSELRKTLFELQDKKRQLMEVLLAGAGESDGDVAALRKEVRELEEALSTDRAELGKARKFLTTTVDDVSKAIPKGQVLIEFFRYQKYTAPGRKTPVYGAIVLEKGGEPKFVNLDTAARIEKMMDAYANAVRTQVEDADMEKFLKRLSTSIWEPLQAALPKEGTPLILAPDGALNFLSFATLLVKDDRFLAEAYPLSYVTSGRDLLRQVKPTKENDMAILANPDYQTPAKGEKAAGGGDRGQAVAVSMRGVLGRIGLAPLPGTEKEEAILRSIIADDWGWDLESFMQLDATEAAVSELSSPRILHLATHGFFLPRTGRSDAFTRSAPYWAGDSGSGGKAGNPLESFGDVVLENPMHRSGVALTGAEATLKSWGQGVIGDTRNDGVLSAEEMAQLNLDGTWLVVLSACETGLGEARSGEGVLGMRRGLIQSGAQNLLLTLWPVADEETVLFMGDFYRNLDKGKKQPSEVAPVVQAAYLKKFRKERGISDAVRLAGPFILSFQQ